MDINNNIMICYGIIVAGNYSGTPANITFPNTYQNLPIVLATQMDGTIGNGYCNAHTVQTVNTNNAQIKTTYREHRRISWFCMGS